MKRNPFAPEVPCHRIIQSNLKIGGFYGQVSGFQVFSFSFNIFRECCTKGSKEGIQVSKKRALLLQEGLAFDEDGYLNVPLRIERQYIFKNK